jgi:large conductance mechanosensitive channel
MLFKRFRDFVMRGNVLDLAVGIVFGTIVNSLVKDVIMPPVAFLLGAVDFNDLFVVIKPGRVADGPYGTLLDAQAAGALTLNYGLFLSTIISFLIIAFIVFLVVNILSHLRKNIGKYWKNKKSDASSIKFCPFCAAPLAPKDFRCPACSHDLMLFK